MRRSTHLGCIYSTILYLQWSGHQHIRNVLRNIYKSIILIMDHCIFLSVALFKIGHTVVMCIESFIPLYSTDVA